MNRLETGAVAIGLDIGATNIKAILIDASGNISERVDRLTVNDVPQLIGVVREILAGFDRPQAAVGIASPGLAGTDNRAIRWMRGRLDAVEGLDWTEALGRTAWLLNDAHAATIGEAWIGAAAGRRHVVLLTLGTGVGGGVIVDGRLLQGALGRAGHHGHITVDSDGPADITGAPGSLEDAIGDHTVARRTAGRFSSTAELVDAVRSGDSGARQAWTRSVRCLAAGVSSLINVLDPEVVVIGGGIAKAGEILFEPLARELERFEWRPTDTAVEIVPAALGDAAGAVGAARFAMTRREGLTP